MIRGTRNIPIAYVYREDAVVDQEARDAEYPDSDSQFMRCSLLQGPEYMADRKQLWDILFLTIINMAAAPYVKRFQRNFNARSAILDLKGRGEGSSMQHTRQAEAEQVLASATYDGKSRRYPLDVHIDRVVDAFQVLDQYGDVRTDDYKVRALLQGIQAPQLQNAKDMILIDDRYNSDFQAAYQHLKTIDASKKTTSAGLQKRQISEVSGSKKHQGGGKGKKTRWIPLKEWKAMSEKQKEELRKERASAGIKRKASGGANKGDRKVSFVETTMDEYEKMPEDQKRAVQKVAMDVFNLETNKEIEGSENGDQFGRMVYAMAQEKKKAKKN